MEPRAPIGVITREDVAVIRAALNRTESDTSVLLLDRIASGSLWQPESLPRGAERDFNRRNHEPVQIPDSIGIALQARLVDHDTLPEPGPWFSKDSRVWHSSISMPGYSNDGRFAVIMTGYTCGSLCGSAGGIVLKRTHDGWRVLRHFGTMVF